MSLDAGLDTDGYPTEAAITHLTEWGDASSESSPVFDVNGAIDFMRSLWHMSEWGIHDTIEPDECAVYRLTDGHRYVKMSTGGWSGNEELMNAFQERWWRRQSIVVTRRGGHYILEYTKEVS